MCVAGRARAEVDRVDSASREVRHVRPGLLGLEGQVAGVAQRADERRVRDDRGGRRVARDLELAPAGARARRYSAALSGVRSGAYLKLTVATARSGITLSAIPASSRVIDATS